MIENKFYRYKHEVGPEKGILNYIIAKNMKKRRLGP